MRAAPLLITGAGMAFGFALLDNPAPTEATPVVRLLAEESCLPGEPTGDGGCPPPDKAAPDRETREAPDEQLRSPATDPAPEDAGPTSTTDTEPADPADRLPPAWRTEPTRAERGDAGPDATAENRRPDGATSGPARRRAGLSTDDAPEADTTEPGPAILPDPPVADDGPPAARDLPGAADTSSRQQDRPAPSVTTNDLLRTARDARPTRIAALSEDAPRPESLDDAAPIDLLRAVAADARPARIASLGETTPRPEPLDKATSKLGLDRATARRSDTPGTQGQAKAFPELSAGDVLVGPDDPDARPLTRRWLPPRGEQGPPREPFAGGLLDGPDAGGRTSPASPREDVPREPRLPENARPVFQPVLPLIPDLTALNGYGAWACQRAGWLPLCGSISTTRDTSPDAQLGAGSTSFFAGPGFSVQGPFPDRSHGAPITLERPARELDYGLRGSLVLYLNEGGPTKAPPDKILGISSKWGVSTSVNLSLKKLLNGKVPLSGAAGVWLGDLGLYRVTWGCDDDGCRGLDTVAGYGAYAVGSRGMVGPYLTVPNRDLADAVKAAGGLGPALRDYFLPSFPPGPQPPPAAPGDTQRSNTGAKGDLRQHPNTGAKGDLQRRGEGSSGKKRPNPGAKSTPRPADTDAKSDRQRSNTGGSSKKRPGAGAKGDNRRGSTNQNSGSTNPVNGSTGDPGPTVNRGAKGDRLDLPGPEIPTSSLTPTGPALADASGTAPRRLPVPIKRVDPWANTPPRTYPTFQPPKPVGGGTSLTTGKPTSTAFDDAMLSIGDPYSSLNAFRRSYGDPPIKPPAVPLGGGGVRRDGQLVRPGSPIGGSSTGSPGNSTGVGSFTS